MLRYRSYRYIIFILSIISLFTLNFISTTTFIYYEEILNIFYAIENDNIRRTGVLLIKNNTTNANLPNEVLVANNITEKQGYNMDSYNLDTKKLSERQHEVNEILTIGTTRKEEYNTTNEESKEIVTKEAVTPTYIKETRITPIVQDDEQKVVDEKYHMYNYSKFDFIIVYEGNEGLIEFSKQFWDLKFCDAISKMSTLYNNNMNETDHNNNNHSTGNNTMVNYMYSKTIKYNNDKNKDSILDLYQYTKKNRILYNISFSCNDLYYSKGVGTGNYIMAFYLLRLIAKIFGNIEVNIQCNDTEIMKDTLILPWLTGSFPFIKSVSKNIISSSMNNEKFNGLLAHRQVCRKYSQTYMVHDMRYELRRMAISLVGIPYKGHPAEKWAHNHLWSNRTNTDNRMSIQDPIHNTKPIYSNNIILDDIIFHFRCGDIIEQGHDTFGFMKYKSYMKFIMGKKNYNSIGIVTQPFYQANGQHRKIDRKGNHKCKLLLFAFRKYLNNILNHDTKKTSNNTYSAADTKKSKYRKMMKKDSNNKRKKTYIRIRIRNDSSETIALTFARIIMAKYIVIGTTSFGSISSLASFGKSYILETNYKRGPNSWLSSTEHHVNITNLVNNVQMIHEPLLSSAYVKNHWGNNGEHILDWLRNYSQQEQQ